MIGDSHLRIPQRKFATASKGTGPQHAAEKFLCIENYERKDGLARLIGGNMKKYMLKRILFSIFSLLVVVMVVMFLIYTAINRNVIFQNDDVWNKRNGNERTMYEYTQFQKYGYLDFANYTSFLANKYTALYGEAYTSNPDYIADRNALRDPATFQSNASVMEFAKEYAAKGYKIKYLEPLTYKSGKAKPGGDPYLIAERERSVFLRLVDYLKGFFTVETVNDVQDPELTDRYIRIEKDPYSGLFAVVGSGTTHKYLLYFDGRFPFIHQNWIHMNLGTSYTTYRGQEITEVMNNPTGNLKTVRTQYPSKIGTDEYIDTAVDFHTLTYNTGTVSEVDKQNYPDKYTVAGYMRDGLSILETSFVIGLLATVLQYMLGIPLGIWMARHKDGIGDKLGNAYIIFIMAVPSLAYIFMFAAIATTVFGLPYKFANAEVRVLAYIMPTISLALPWIGSLMKWTRRYMIDQMNSDYVKFARAEGLSEREIYNIHISRNAVIPIVHGIPANILGCLTGALVTEQVYGVPGVGRLLITAINQSDNGVIIACTVFYTTLSIVSLILGDVLLAAYDPRIKLTGEGGGGR